MTDLLSVDLVDKKLVTDQMVLTVGYDIENLKSEDGRRLYRGEVTTDHYGRKIPKHAHGTANIGQKTSSTKLITDAVISVTYFRPDKRKSGGEYITVTGKVRKVDTYKGKLIMTDKSEIPIREILSIEIESGK